MLPCGCKIYSHEKMGRILYFAQEHEIDLITFRGGIYDCMRRIINIGKTKLKLIKGNKNGD